MLVTMSAACARSKTSSGGDVKEFRKGSEGLFGVQAGHRHETQSLGRLGRGENRGLAHLLGNVVELLKLRDGRTGHRLDVGHGLFELAKDTEGLNNASSENGTRSHKTHTSGPRLRSRYAQRSASPWIQLRQALY